MKNIEQIVAENANLVYSIVNKFKSFYDVDDLKQVGMMGLVKAFKHYDNSYDTKFSTFAYTYILGEILKYIREDKSIRVNKNLIKISRSIDKAKEALTHKLMRSPTTSELCSFLEIPESLFYEAETSKDFVKSLDFALNEETDDKDLSLYDSIGVVEKNTLPEIQDLRNELSNLQDNDKKLLYDRYFLDKTQTEISKELGMSQVQVSRYETKVLLKLKKVLQ